MIQIKSKNFNKNFIPDWCTLPHSLWRKWLDWSQNVLFTKNWYNFYAKTILIHSGDFFVIRTTIVISDQNLIKMFIRLILNHNWLKQLFTLAIAQNFKLTKKPAKLTFNITCFPRVYIKKLNFINIVTWLFICCVIQTISQLLVCWTLFKNNWIKSKVQLLFRILVCFITFVYFF